MQKKKNIRLLIILAISVVVTVATYFLLRNNDGNSSYDKAMFALEDVSQIDSVSLINGEEVKTLHFKNNSWSINNRYPADPQKLTVLFAVLNQVKARRPAAEAEKQKVDSLFDEQGTEVRFFEEKELVKRFEVTGFDERNITYFRDGGEAYVVNIPGYRSYLASIFEMNISGWRNKLIFDDVSWSNLEMVNIAFPTETRSGFTVEPAGGFYSVSGVAATDSAKLLDYLDRVSLLRADEFIEGAPDTIQNNDPMISIAITDIRNRPFTLNIFEASKGPQFFARKDTSEWLLISKSAIEPLLKDSRYFVRKE